MDFETFAKVRSMVKQADDETKKVEEGMTVSSVSMKRSEKERFSRIAKDHQMSLSGFLRIAADEFIKNHGWE